MTEPYAELRQRRGIRRFSYTSLVLIPGVSRGRMVTNCLFILYNARAVLSRAIKIPNLSFGIFIASNLRLNNGKKLRFSLNANLVEIEFKGGVFVVKNIFLKVGGEFYIGMKFIYVRI